MSNIPELAFMILAIIFSGACALICHSQREKLEAGSDEEKFYKYFSLTFVLLSLLFVAATIWVVIIDPPKAALAAEITISGSAAGGTAENADPESTGVLPYLMGFIFLVLVLSLYRTFTGNKPMSELGRKYRQTSDELEAVQKKLSPLNKRIHILQIKRGWSYELGKLKSQYSQAACSLNGNMGARGRFRRVTKKYNLLKLSPRGDVSSTVNQLLRELGWTREDIRIVNNRVDSLEKALHQLENQPAPAAKASSCSATII